MAEKRKIVLAQDWHTNNQVIPAGTHVADIVLKAVDGLRTNTITMVADGIRNGRFIDADQFPKSRGRVPEAVRQTQPQAVQAQQQPQSTAAAATAAADEAQVVDE